MTDTPQPQPSPSKIVASEEQWPDYGGVRTEESKLYHSGQAKLFSDNVASTSVSVPHRVDDVHLHAVPHLDDYLGKLPRMPNAFFRTRTGDEHRSGFTVPIDADQVVLVDLVRTPAKTSGTAFIRAGPRCSIVYQPDEVVAAIVSCGGLCPGMNDVISEIVRMLHYNYSVNKIYGISMGYRGFYEEQFMPYQELNPKVVRGIHRLGGTVLGSSRGGFDKDKIIDALLKHGINQVYVIGGDGTHRGASALFDEIQARKLKISIIGVPKTIDNDVGIIDRSFGFNTAVEQAERAVASARVEARCCPNGIGLVKLMGRHAGFIAAHATLANRDVDLCLIPEIPICVDGPSSILKHIETAIEKNGHCTIVLAEGAGAQLMEANGETDESGNQVLPEIGKFLKQRIKKHFKEKKIPVSIKYNDPSYMIRSVPANASDSIYCMILAQSAVHGAMAGYTGFTSGLVNNRTVYLPINLITASSPTFLNPGGRTWERVLRTTHQPHCPPQKK